MPLLWARCTVDPSHLHELNRPLAMYPAMPTCPDCGAATVHDMSVGQRQSTVDPVVVFRGPDGQIRFPGDANGTSAHVYATQGFERIEIRGAAEMRRFEKAMNATEYSRAARRLEHKQSQREERQRILRGELRQRMQSMSTAGRAIARAVMDRNDNRPRERVADANFHSEVYSFDRSNRDESRDSQGRRRRD
jgi:hypothetical protein